MFPRSLDYRDRVAQIALGRGSAAGVRVSDRWAREPEHLEADVVVDGGEAVERMIEVTCLDRLRTTAVLE